MSSFRESREFKEQWIASKWRESVGNDVDRRTSPNRLTGNVLHVNVASSVWATQLQALKIHILKELNKRIYPLSVKDLRFQVQYPLRRPHAVRPSQQDDGEAVPPHAMPLDDETMKKIDEIVHTLDDVSLRETLHSLLIREEQLKAHRRSLGWKPCQGCGVLIWHRVFCPFCILHGVPDTEEKENPGSHERSPLAENPEIGPKKPGGAGDESFSEHDDEE